MTDRDARWGLLVLYALLTMAMVSVLNAQVPDTRARFLLMLRPGADTSTLAPKIRQWGGVVNMTQQALVGGKLDYFRIGDSLMKRPEIRPDTFRTGAKIDSIVPWVHYERIFIFKPDTTTHSLSPLSDAAWDIAMTGAPFVWPFATGPVMVGVLDTGYGPNALGEPVECYNGVYGTTTGCQDDHALCQGHGTHTSGTVWSMIPQARRVMLKMTDANDIGPNCSLYEGAFVGGLLWMTAQPGLKVVSASIGTGMPFYCDDVAAFVAAGGVFVGASGNESGPVLWPGSCPGAIMVGSVDGSFNRAPHSSWILSTQYPDSHPALFVVGPGVSITSLAPGGGWATMSGTSMATPHVAGEVGLLLSAGVPVSQINTALVAGTVPAYPDGTVGSGFARVDRSLAALHGGVLTTPDTVRTYPTNVGTIRDSIAVVSLGVSVHADVPWITLLDATGASGYFKWLFDPSLFVGGPASASIIK